MTLEDRLAAVERTLTEDEHAPVDLSSPAALETRLETVESRLDDIESRLADAEGTVAALRGDAEDGRSVDRETEQVAQRALATAREARRRLDEETPTPRERRVVVEESASDDGLRSRLRSLW